VAYDYIEFILENHPDLIQDARLIYFGSLELGKLKQMLSKKIDNDTFVHHFTNRSNPFFRLDSEFPTAEYAKYQAGYAFYPDFK